MRETQSERADDLPVIIHWLKQMEIEKLIDQEFPPPHGNRKGLSYGQLVQRGVNKQNINVGE